MQKAGDIILTVKFEDGKKVTMTAAQIAKLRDPRKYEVLDPRGRVVFKKSFRGL